MRPIKILFFLQTVGVGGVERQLFILTDQLSKRGHDVTLSTMHIHDEDWKSLWGNRNVALNPLFAKEPNNLFLAGWQMLTAIITLRNQIKKEKYQVVYATQWAISEFIAWVATRRLKGTKLVWCARGGAGMSHTSIRKNWKIVLTSRLTKLVSHTVPLMIAVSKGVLESLKARGSRCSNMVVIPDGIDTEMFKPDAPAESIFRSEWLSQNKEIVIGLVGRLDPQKGHKVFIKAVSLLINERPDLVFVCVGDGPDHYRNELHQLSRDLDLQGHILWAGTRQDMAAVYNSLDIVCTPSYHEGFNLVIGEAMACGVPCVVTSTADPAAIVGDLGVAVCPDDPQELADGLKEMLLRLPHIDHSLLRKRIVKCFSVDAMVDANEQAFFQLINGSDKISGNGL